MSLTFTGATGLFTIMGKAIYAALVNNTNRSESTADKVPKEMVDAIVQFNNLTPTKFLDAVVAVIPSGIQAYQNGCTVASQAIRQFCQQLLIEMVRADSPQPNLSLQIALQEVLDQMLDSGDLVEATTVSAGTPAMSGAGNGYVWVSVLRADGKTADFTFAETLKIRCTKAGTGRYPSATFSIRGEFAEPDRLSQYWPRGSGVSAVQNATQANNSNNLIVNGGFDEEADVAGDGTGDNFPESWIPITATIGTTLKLTDYEVQRIVVTGSPSAGHYIINWQNQDGLTQSTETLIYNASQSTVQAALRKLKGLEYVDVATSGTTPNFTHVITFTGVSGDLQQVSVTNRTTGGTFTPSTTTAGTANMYLGRALEFDGNGTELTKIYAYPLSGRLKPVTQYNLTFLHYLDSTPAAGVVRYRLVDGISGATITDQEGNDNAVQYTISAIPTGVWLQKNAFFRIPRELPDIIYLEIALTTALSNTASYFVDEVRLVEMKELYPGGPSVDIIEGATPFQVGDIADVEMSNLRECVWQEWFYRLFSPETIQQSGGGGCLILPVGTATILDSLIG